MGESASVFQADCQAIVHGINLLEEGRQSVSFLVDTQAVVKSLENPRTDKSTMLKLKTTLNSVGKTREIVVKWIKGHVGHYGNELADKKAKEGSGKTLTGSAPFFPVSRTTTIQAINRYTRDLR